MTPAVTSEVSDPSVRNPPPHRRIRAAAPRSELEDVADAAQNGQSSGPETNDLLRALVAVNGRLAFPEDRLRVLVSPTGNAAYLQAYRISDGRTPLTAIAQDTGLDLGNLSKAVTKWVDLGIAFRLGPKGYCLHLYPLAVATSKVGTAAKRKASSVGGGINDRGKSARAAVDSPEPTHEGGVHVADRLGSGVG